MPSPTQLSSLRLNSKPKHKPKILAISLFVISFPFFSLSQPQIHKHSIRPHSRITIIPSRSYVNTQLFFYVHMHASAGPQILQPNPTIVQSKFNSINRTYKSFNRIRKFFNQAPQSFNQIPQSFNRTQKSFDRTPKSFKPTP